MSGVDELFHPIQKPMLIRCCIKIFAPFYQLVQMGIILTILDVYLIEALERSTDRCFSRTRRATN